MLDHLGRYIKRFVSTVGPSSNKFASDFDIAHFYRRKTHKNHVVWRAISLMNQRLVTVDRQRLVEKKAVTAVTVDLQRPI